jgi:hypothetical protein
MQYNVGCCSHSRLGVRISKPCGFGDARPGKIAVAEKRQLDRHKKEPREVHAPGVATGCCLSLWALLIRAAGVSGDGVPLGSGPQSKIRITSRYGFGSYRFDIIIM